MNLKILMKCLMVYGVTSVAVASVICAVIYNAVGGVIKFQDFLGDAYVKSIPAGLIASILFYAACRRKEGGEIV